MNSFNLNERIQPIDRNNGFRMKDYYVWDGSIIEGEDGRWHMFATRWPDKYEMQPGWLFYSEVVRASSDTPEGPYEFEEVVLPQRDPCYFDGRMTHNPSIRKSGDTYLLFYIGTSYINPLKPGAENMPTKFSDPWVREIWSRKRIGLATSKSIFGPWERQDEPILKPRPDHWDNGITSNPSPFVMDDGSIYMAYKSSKPIDPDYHLQPFNIGIARADNWHSPFERISDKPALDVPEGDHFLEDPFLWHADGKFHMIMKDIKGSYSKKDGCGIYAHSKDALEWTFGDPVIAYTRDVEWKDGVEEVGQIERPQLVFDKNGKLTHFTAATAYSSGHLANVSESWVSVFPVT